MTVYARIDISFPDQRRESHQLANEAITIGSAPDDTIRVPAACLAQGQIRLSRGDSSVTLRNLAEDPSLIVDGRLLPVNQSRQLGDVANIRAGALSIQFIRSSDGPTVSMRALTEITQPSALGFRASLASGALNVWPYSSASTEVSITNLTDEAAQFRVETAGLPAAWTSPSRLAVAVESADTVDILINIKPPAGLELAPGEYPLTISVSRLGEVEARVQLALLVRLGRCAGLSLALDPPNLRQQRVFSLHLLNLGNDDLSLKLAACDPSSLLDLNLAQDEIRLKPKGRAAIGGSVAPKRRPLLGQPSEIPFAILAKAAEPNDYLVALPASLAVKPLVSNRALIAAASAIIALVLALAALLHQPPQPSITSFALSAKQVARGTPVSLTWAAGNAERFFVEVERAPLAELPADAATYTLDTGDYRDPIEIALIAVRGDAADIRSLRLNVFQPVTIHRFETDKSSVPRGVGAELTITWHVSGAAALDIALPVGFETIHEASAGDEGEIVIFGKAADEVVISLRAVDELGTAVERAIAIAARAPECRPIEDALLYTGPDPRYRRANYAQQNVPVLVNGVTVGADWLRVELASGDHGWGRLRDFDCAGFDPAGLKVVSDIPPLPTETAAPAAEIFAGS
ncbi:MAG: hypothetical protein OXG85_13305 [Chloroflexi bacterium]|nr:hypothetical protein [Chloroflexota bacterium]